VFCVCFVCFLTLVCSVFLTVPCSRPLHFCIVCMCFGDVLVSVWFSRLAQTIARHFVIFLTIHSSYLFRVMPIVFNLSAQSPFFTTSHLHILHKFTKSLRTLGRYVRAQGEAPCTRISPLCAGEGNWAIHIQSDVKDMGRSYIYTVTSYSHHPGAKRPRGGVYRKCGILQQFAYTPPNHPHQPFPHFF